MLLEAGAAGSLGAARDGQKPHIFNRNSTRKPERTLPVYLRSPGFGLLSQHSFYPRCTLLHGLLIGWVIQGKIESTASHDCGSGGLHGRVDASPLGRRWELNSWKQMQRTGASF